MVVLRFPRLRRTLALLLTWCFLLATLEAPVADVHDGGASHAEVDRVTGEPHADHAHAFGHGSPDQPVPDPSDHPVHVCHCTHAHAGLLEMADVGLPLMERAVPLVTASAMLPPTLSLAPPTRPPRA